MFDTDSDISLNIPKPKFKTLSELISLSVKLFFKGFWFITKVSLLVYIPLATIGMFIFKTDMDNFNRSIFFHIPIYLFVLYSFRSLIYPAVIFGIAHYLKFKNFPTILDAFHFAWHKWGQVLVRCLVASLITLFGCLLFFIPGILVSIAYSLIPVVVCFEGNTPKDSIRRSRELSIGNRRLIFFSASVLGILALFAELIMRGSAYILVHFLHFGFLTEYSGIVIIFFSTIMGNVVLILYILIYLTLVKERKKKAKETWLLRWAR
jgi:hypothetical protein